MEMLKVTPHVTACRLTIQLRPVATGSEASITYTHTSLGPEGDAFVASFTEGARYRQFMQDWEARINHYLVHGSALRATGWLDDSRRPAITLTGLHPLPTNGILVAITVIKSTLASSGRLAM